MAGYVMLILVSMIWGMSYILIKKSLLVIDPVQLASTRIFIASLMFLPMALHYFDRKVFKLHWQSLAVVGFIGSGIPAILFAIAQTGINSSLTGALSSLTPLCTLLVGIFFYGVRATKLKVIGIILGLAGAFLIVFSKTDDSAVANPYFGLLILLAAKCYAWSTNVIGSKLKGIPSLQISVMAFTLLFFPATFVFIYAGVPGALIEGSLQLKSLWPVILLALMSTVLASVLYFYLIQLTDSVFASTVSYLTPVVAFGFGIQDGEPLYLIHLFATVVMLTGIVFTRSDRSSKHSLEVNVSENPWPDK